MSWNIIPECVSTVILCIVWTYSRKGSFIPSLKNKVFQACFLVTFLAMASNLLSTLMIYLLHPYILVPTWIVTSVYFVFTPLMGIVYYYYTLAVLYEGQKMSRALLISTSIPSALYVMMVLINPLTRGIFDITLEGGYVRGPYIIMTYAIFYLYCLMCLVSVILRGKTVEKATRPILYSFPIIAAIVVIVQMAIPDAILSGSAATCALLLIYLFLQNKQISIDALTGIPNRQSFFKVLELRQKREAGKAFSIVVLSLTGFSKVNDAYGQSSGDAFLSAVSAYLAQNVGAAQLYRYSGDEFALILSEEDAGRIDEIAQRIIWRMSFPWNVKGIGCLLTGAIGIVHYPSCAGSAEGLINGIECAVAHAKAQGGSDAICYCDAQLLDAAQRRQRIEAILRDCMKNDGFTVYYQPILSTKNGNYPFAEALLRITQSPIGPISPGEFIPIAEQSGLIVDITYIVLDKVCACLRRLLDSDIPIHGISVNFSPRHFTQSDIIPRILDITKRHGVPVSLLKIEITETTLAENPELITAFAQRVSDMGVHIGLDDFGMGFSNLSSVIALPINTVKLDKSLIWSAMENERSCIVVQNLSRTFQELGMAVLAEGIETMEQSEFATDCGCSFIQGFLYARPMDEAAFRAHLLCAARDRIA